MGAKLPGGIQLGFSQLGGHKFCHGLGDCMGPMCSCGAEVQGNKHFFLALPIPCRWWMGSPWRPLFGGSFGPFNAVGGGLWAVSRVGGSACASPSGVYPVGGLRWRFSCGLDFGCGL